MKISLEFKWVVVQVDLQNWEVMGSNPTWCCAFFPPSLFPEKLPFVQDQAPQGSAFLLMM